MLFVFLVQRWMEFAELLCLVQLCSLLVLSFSVQNVGVVGSWLAFVGVSLVCASAGAAAL